MNLNEIVSAGLSCEVIAHCGNIRACIFGKLEKTAFDTGDRYIIKPNKETSSASIIFTAENVTKIDNTSTRHKVIYIS